MLGKGLLDAWRASRYKVVHQLPGRIRLWAPALERLPAEWEHHVPGVVDIVKHGEGIADVQITLATGRVLVLYDPERTDVRQIEQWIKYLGRLAQDEFKGRKPDSMECVQQAIGRIHECVACSQGGVTR